MRLDKRDILAKLVLAVEKLKDEDTTNLLIEDLNIFNVDDLKFIESQTNLKVINGIKVFASFLPLVLKETYEGLNENLKEEEVLIIGDDEEVTIEIIESLYKEVGFITLAGEYENTIENISKYILEKTGLSIFYSKKLDKILTNYPIIINLKDNYSLNVGKLRKKAIIFDCSISKGLKAQIAANRGMDVVEDLLFKIDYLDIKVSKFLNSVIPSYIYEQFNRLNPEDFVGLSVRGELWDIKSFVDYQIRTKGKYVSVK